MSADVSKAQFWNERYLRAETGWDKGQPAPPLVRLAQERVAGSPLLALGAGRGHDALHFAKAGYAVTALDFAPEACAAIRAAATAQGVALEVLEADLFELPATHAGRFASALEHTCFCAIDPARRAEYARAVHALLAPGGVYFGLFYAHGREGGPPFTTDEAELRALFGPLFELTRLVRAPDSFPARAGEELEFVFRRRES